MDKKILFISDKFPPHIGGMETHAHEFVKHFRGVDGYSVDALSFTYDETPDNLGIPPEQFAQFSAVNDVHHVLPYSSIYTPEHINDWLERNPADILFFNSLYWVSIFDVLRDTHSSIKMIMRSGGTDIRQSKIIGKGDTLDARRSFVSKMVNGNLDHLVITTDYVRRSLNEIGIDLDVMESFVGGVDTRRFKPISESEKLSLRQSLDLPTDGKIVLCVSRFIPVKGINFAIEAMHKVIKDSRDTVYFLLVGGGPMEKQIESFISTNGLEERVIRRNFVPVTEIQNFYACSDVYLQMSTFVTQQEEGGSFRTTEHMGRTFMEALSCGLPVVATGVGGIPEVVSNGVNGFLVDDRDTVSAANMVTTLLQDDKLRLKFGKSGRKISEEKFDWARIFEEYEKRLF